MATPIALTNQMNYALKPTAVACQRKQVVIPASNKTSFDDGDTSVHYLPSLRNNVMDGKSGYFKFTANITGAGLLDVSAQSFINRIQTYGPGGQLISDIQGYNVIATMLTDLQIDQSNKIGLSPLLGTSEDYYTATSAMTYTAQTAKDAFATLPAAQVNAGTAFNTLTTTTTLTSTNRKGMDVADGTSYTFCIPILHPLFTLSEKYIPSFAMSDDIRVEITWESVASALVSSTNYTISNPEIIVDYLQFDDAVFNMVRQTYAGRDLIIPCQDYHHYSSTIASATGNFSAILPCKARSARAIFFAFRPSETQTSASYTLGSRVNPMFKAGDYFNLNVGGQRLPQKPITTSVDYNFAPWFAETQRALHSFNSLEMNGSIPRTYYNSAPVASGVHYSNGTSAYKNGFALALNLDQLTNKGEQQNSGLSLSNITTYYEGYLSTAPLKADGATANPISVDAFVLHDTLLVVGADTGLMSAQR